MGEGGGDLPLPPRATAQPHREGARRSGSDRPPDAHASPGHPCPSAPPDIALAMTTLPSHSAAPRAGDSSQRDSSTLAPPSSTRLTLLIGGTRTDRPVIPLDVESGDPDSDDDSLGAPSALDFVASSLRPLRPDGEPQESAQQATDAGCWLPRILEHEDPTDQLAFGHRSADPQLDSAAVPASCRLKLGSIVIATALAVMGAPALTACAFPGGTVDPAWWRSGVSSAAYAHRDTEFWGGADRHALSFSLRALTAEPGAPAAAEHGLPAENRRLDAVADTTRREAPAGPRRYNLRVYHLGECREEVYVPSGWTTGARRAGSTHTSRSTVEARRGDNHDRRVRAAVARMRRLVRGYGLRCMLTLTFAQEMSDWDRAMSAGAAFLRSTRREWDRRWDCPFFYVLVPAIQTKRSASVGEPIWSFHIAVSKDWKGRGLSAHWKHGSWKVTLHADPGITASYLRTNILESEEARPPGTRRFHAARGMTVAKSDSWAENAEERDLVSSPADWMPLESYLHTDSGTETRLLKRRGG
jgi:hypothetical protein